jgi:hypothetical protein
MWFDTDGGVEVPDEHRTVMRRLAQVRQRKLLGNIQLYGWRFKKTMRDAGLKP